MPEPSVWIARIVFDPRVVAKLLDKHGVASWEVEEACVLGSHREARWHTHPEFGRRLLVRGKTYRGDEIFAYLVPIDEQDGIWECRTARRLSS
jgi:hypothetical protein